MTNSFRTLDDLGDVAGKRVLVRVDLNVPMQDGKVSDDTRLRATVPTVAELADKGAIVLLLAHFGRPKGQRRPDMSLALLTRPYSHVLGREVRFIDDCCGDGAKAAIETLAPGAPVFTVASTGQLPDYRAIVKKFGPAVVGITVSGNHTATAEERGLPPGAVRPVQLAMPCRHLPGSADLRMSGLIAGWTAL